MEIFSVVWTQFLYIPLINVLIWLYTTYAGYNLGVAVVILTIIIRVFLLPFTVMNEFSRAKTSKNDEKVKEIAEDYKHDPVARKQAIRKYLRAQHVRHWPKFIVLMVQALILVLLYQVFVAGISINNQLHVLYSRLIKPDFVNTQFLWFDIGERDLLICAIVAGYIFAEVLMRYLLNRTDASKISMREQVFMVFFPAFTFLILALLPAVKAIFILTSLVFSSIISGVILILRAATNPEKKEIKEEPPINL